MILADNNTANSKWNLHQINLPLNLGTSIQVHWGGQQQNQKPLDPQQFQTREVI